MPIRLDVQPIALLQHAAGEDRPRVEREADGRRIDHDAFVAEGQAARDHPQPGQLRQAVDDAFRDAVGEVFNLLIGAGVRQREHREGLAAFPCCATAAQQPGGSGAQRAQGHREVARGLEPPRRMAVDGAGDDRGELRRRRRIEPGDVGTALVQHAGDHLLRRIAVEEPRAAQHLVEHAAEREDIAAAVDGLPEHLLR